MSDETKKPLIAINFLLKSLQPDRRQYKPSNPLLEPADPLLIVVNVPLDHEHIFNAKDILTAQLSGKEGKDEPKPKLTPLGMKFIVDAFEAVMSDPESKAEKSESDDLEWEDEKTSDETWEDTSTEPEKVAGEDDETENTSDDDEDVTWEEDDEPEAEDKSDAEDLEWDEEDL